MSELRVQIFEPDGSPALFVEYLRLKYSIFAKEQGWKLPKDELEDMAVPDPFDRQSVFAACLCETEVIGIMRLHRISEDFPRMELFHNHLDKMPIASVRANGLTLNALALQKPWRGKRLIKENGVSLAEWFVRESITQLAIRMSAMITLLSVIPDRSLWLMAKLGAYVLDVNVPCQEPGAPHTGLLNLALLPSELASLNLGRGIVLSAANAEAVLRCKNYLMAVEKEIETSFAKDDDPWQRLFAGYLAKRRAGRSQSLSEN